LNPHGSSDLLPFITTKSMTKEDLLQKIREAESNKATKFEAEGESLTELPADIGRLINLQSLNVSGNQLSHLPKEIAELINLEEFYLMDNQLSELPKEITKLTNLQVLDLSGNQLKVLPEEITELTKLESFALNGNQFREVPEEITKLTTLQWLELRDLQLEKLPKAIAKLNNLQELYLSGNQLRNLPNEISELFDLKVLDLLDNQLRELPQVITELTNLEVLDLSGNQLRKLSRDITNLTNLNEIYLSRNKFDAFPNEIHHLHNLKLLNVDENQLEDFADSLVRLDKIDLNITSSEQVFLIPTGIITGINNAQELLDYFSQLKRGESKKLNEAKILVVGQANAGKTSLIERLIYGGYEPYRKPTNGIKIYKDWKEEISDRNIQLNVWDFGGQEINHATHQFFLTKRSLYILTIDSTLDSEENRIDYWLEKIKILAESSPVIIVGNKIDERQVDINLSGLSKKHPNIRGFHPVSCKTKEGLVELKEALIGEISKLDELNDVLPASWFAVKEDLENMSEEYFSFETYLEVCCSKGITEEEVQNKLLERLHDLGIVLNFGNRTQDTNVLNPEWVTKGVYDILNANELFKSKGILKREMLAQILDKDKYPIHKQLYIVNIMQEFELCFEIDPGRTFLVPDLLSEEELNTGSWDESLRFLYQYNILFNSIITHFIVKMHKSISQSTYWRTGAVVEYRVGNELKNEALVKADTAGKKIIIAVRGHEHTRRDFLSIIRGKFDEIHRSFPEEFEEHVAEKIPIPSHPEIVVDYKHLLTLEDMGESEIIPEGLKEKFLVKDLLNGIESAEVRKRLIRNNDLDDQAAKKERFDILDKIKTGCDKESERYGNYLMRGIVVVTSIIHIGFVVVLIYLIFLDPEKGWDTYEKWTFAIFAILESLNLVSSVIFFFLTSKDYSWSEIRNSLIENKKEKKYLAYNFDLNEYEKLQRELEELK
jgi:internalin A